MGCGSSIEQTRFLKSWLNFPCSELAPYILEPDVEDSCIIRDLPNHALWFPYLFRKRGWTFKHFQLIEMTSLSKTVDDHICHVNPNIHDRRLHNNREPQKRLILITRWISWSKGFTRILGKQQDKSCVALRFSTSTNKRKVRSFLWMCNVYHCSIE